jgi:uncharacterized Fe-S cluster-containing radical SAM superfamily protein
MPFDPIERAAEVEAVVMKGRRRRYHRFRAAPYYGGIATADALGCDLLCAYCWNYYRNLHPERSGAFHSPESVAGKLLGIARKKRWHLYRMTGSEPVLGDASLDHLAEVQRLISSGDPDGRFILETNGIMLGHRPELTERLEPKGLAVRVAIKGVDPESFERITGAEGSYLECQIRAVKLLQDLGVETWPALMEDLFTRDQIGLLRKRLAAEGIAGELELEYLERYPYVMKELKKHGIEASGRDRTADNK